MTIPAITFTASINAYTLYKGAKKLGVEIYTTSDTQLFNIPQIKERSYSKQWLCFTEEASLRRALEGELSGSYLPSKFPIDLLDDKWCFANWLVENKKLTNAPKQWLLTNIHSLDFPFLIKAKHSWKGKNKLPRGWLCRNEQDIEYALKKIKSLNYSPDWFFAQQWLDNDDLKVISVCGFFDHLNKKRNLQVAVKRVASNQIGLSCSAAVETINDNWTLVERAHAILDSLSFVGPYEIEFLVSSKCVLVLELNPRFWLQHSIFMVNGNGLLKRYFDKDTEKDWEQTTLPHSVWINGVQLLRSVFLFKFELVSMTLIKLFTRHTKVIIWPGLILASRIVVRKTFDKLKRRVSAK